MNKVSALKIYPDPIAEESIINREHWLLTGEALNRSEFPEPQPIYCEAVAVTCELKDTFLDKVIDNVTLADKLRSDFCKVLDDLGMDYNTTTRKLVKTDGAKQMFVFYVKD